MKFGGSHRFQGLKKLWDSGEGLALLMSFAFCAITGIFMAMILPVESGYGAVGVLFIYITVFMLASALFFRPIANQIMKRIKPRRPELEEENSSA